MAYCTITREIYRICSYTTLLHKQYKYSIPLVEKIRDCVVLHFRDKRISYKIQLDPDLTPAKKKKG